MQECKMHGLRMLNIAIRRMRMNSRPLFRRKPQDFFYNLLTAVKGVLFPQDVRMSNWRLEIRPYLPYTTTTI
jgi:hypothetical protein